MKTPYLNFRPAVFPLVMVVVCSVNGIGQTLSEAIDSLTAAQQAHQAAQDGDGTMKLFQAPPRALAVLRSSAGSTNSGPEAETARLWLTLYELETKPVRGATKAHWKSLQDRVEPISRSANASWRRLTARILQTSIHSKLSEDAECLKLIDLAVADARIPEVLQNPSMLQVFAYSKVPPQDATVELLNLGVYFAARTKNLPEAIRRARAVIEEFPEYARRQNLADTVLQFETGKNPHAPSGKVTPGRNRGRKLQ